MICLALPLQASLSVRRIPAGGWVSAAAHGCTWQVQGGWGAGIIYSFCLALGQTCKVQPLLRGHLISGSVPEGSCLPFASLLIPSSLPLFLLRAPLHPSHRLRAFPVQRLIHPSATYIFPARPVRSLTFLAASISND